MKKIIIILVLFVGVSVNAQQHEVKLDVFDIIGFKALDVTYQFNVNEESSIGIALFSTLGENVGIYNERFAITPYYRLYFPVTGIENVFGEAFLAVNQGVLNPDTDNEKEYSDGAFGFSIGKTFVSNGGVVIEGYFGLGRNVFGNEFAPDVLMRMGINVGYRFD